MLNDQCVSPFFFFLTSLEQINTLIHKRKAENSVSFSPLLSLKWFSEHKVREREFGVNDIKDYQLHFWVVTML